MKKLSRFNLALLSCMSSLVQALPAANQLKNDNLWAGAVNRDYPQSANAIEIDYSYLFFKPRGLLLNYTVYGICNETFHLGAAQQGVGVSKKLLVPCEVYNGKSGFYTTDVEFCAYDEQFKTTCSYTTGEIFIHL
jgi:hypothetical protein